MEIAGYQSDIKITNIFNEDKYTAEKAIAEFGVTTGSKANSYELALTPKLSKPYVKGLRLQVQFHRSNTGAITLNVDGQGALPVVKLTPNCPTDTGGEGDSTETITVPILGNGGLARKAGERDGFSLQPLEANDISEPVHYILVYDGKQFQIVNHIPECLPETTVIVPPPPPTENELFFNRQEYLTIQDDHIDPRIFYAPGRNRYAAINGNLIVARDIRIKRTGGPGRLSGARIKFPKPLDPAGSNTPGALQTLEGKTHYYDMSKDGVIQIQGELFGVNDEINVNIYPYIAKYPLEYDTKLDFSQVTVARTETVAAASKALPKRKTKTVAKPKPKTK